MCKFSSYKNQCMTNNSMMKDLFQENSEILFFSVNRSSKNMLTYALLSFLFFSHGFIQLILMIFIFCFFIFLFFVFVLTNVIYQSQCYFFINTISYVDEKSTQWNLDTQVKIFHENILYSKNYSWNCIS